MDVEQFAAYSARRSEFIDGRLRSVLSCADGLGSIALVAPLFDVILIETHNECTRTCWFCKFGQKRQDAERTQMAWPMIERIVKNLSDLNYRGRISWFWINEPLMDSRMMEIIKYTRRECSEAFISLVTNGDLLTNAVYKDLRQAGLDALGISVYDNPAAAHAEEIEQDGRLVVMDMRHVRVPLLENRGGNIKRHARLFVASQQVHQGKSCARPFKMMTVNAKGQVVLCCADLYSDVVMGDVAKDRLEAIWNNGSFDAYRRQLSERGRAELSLCNNCSYEGSASTVRYPLRSAPGKSGEENSNWVRSGLKRLRDRTLMRLQR
jgi:radical SAM protein with 4Fe4S-binding SPASM domain